MEDNSAVSETTETELVPNAEENATEETTNVVDAVDKPVEVDTAETIKAELENWKKHSRSHEDKAKALTAEKAEWVKGRQEYENKLSTVTTELEETRAELSKLKYEAMTHKIAAEFNLPPEVLSLLRGETEDEIRESADIIAKLQGNAGQQRTPLVIKTQGKESTGKGAEDPISALKRWQIQNLNK